MNVIVFLDEVKILGGTDSGLMPPPGEIQIMSIAATGDKQQKTKFPNYNWYEAVNGDTIGVGQPIFCLPEDQMGDVLSLLIIVVDNDDIAHVYKWTLENVPGWISINGSNPEQAQQTADAFTMWLGSAKQIGSHSHSFTREEIWGAPATVAENRVGNQYVFTAQNVVVTYRILRQYDLDRRVQVKLRPIDIYENGDSGFLGIGGDAEIYVMTRVASQFGARELSATEFRFPSSGTTKMSDNDLFGKSWGTGKEIFSTPSAGPFIYWEVAVWDEDNASIGDDDDMLGIYSGYLLWWQIPFGSDGRGFINVGHRVNGTKGDCYINLDIFVDY